MIRLNALRHILDPIGQRGNPAPFTIEVVKLSTGEIVTGRCTCLGSNHKNDTVRLKFEGSNEIRDFHFSLILSYNGQKIK
jgi:hypothetical protein